VSNGKISIIGTIDVDIKASRMVCSVVAGSFLSTYFFPPNYQKICARSWWGDDVWRMLGYVVR
jgi:hypothetical protein